MNRVPEVSRDALTPDGQAVWDSITSTRGGVRGPFGVLIRVPTLAQRVADLGTYLRFEGLLSGADRELAILVAARELHSTYEWVGHESIARREGVRPEAIEIVRTQASFDGLTPHERLIVSVVLALYREHALSDALFTSARDELGEEQLVELVTLAGNYCMIAFGLLAFNVPLPEGAVDPF